MSDPLADDDKPDAAAAAFGDKVRWLMVLSGVTTLIAIAAVLGVIGYRIFKSEGSVPAADVTALLPKGSRVVAITAAEDRIVVTVEIAGAMEARIFDTRTLRQTGRLRF